MKNLYLVLVALLVLATSGCTPTMDVEAEHAALLEADAEYSNAAAAKDIDRYLSFWADDGVDLPSNAPMVTGKDAIREMMSEIFAVPGYAGSWQPTRMEVARAGDLAYTLGTYEFTLNDPEGNPVADRGKYVTVWKKQLDGSWKVVIDIWNSDQPAPASASEPTSIDTPGPTADEEVELIPFPLPCKAGDKNCPCPVGKRPIAVKRLDPRTGNIVGAIECR